MDNTIGAWQEIADDILSEKEINESMKVDSEPSIKNHSKKLANQGKNSQSQVAALKYVNSESEFRNLYTPLVSLGVGAFGKVYKARCSNDDSSTSEREVAVKEVELYAMDDEREQKKAEEEG